jgi:hypothetical protein
MRLHLSHIAHPKVFKGIKDFEQVAKAPNEAGSKSPRPARRNGKEKSSGSAQRTYAARTILRFQGIENYLTPEQIANMKAVANMQYDQEIGATNG